MISSDYYTLGGPPSFDSVTRDTYKSDESFTLPFIHSVLSGVASLANHLHSRHISHGDLYAHNILVQQNTGFPLVGDFGAATRYDGLDRYIVDSSSNQVNIYQAIQGLEVRAFGCLVDDLIERVSLEPQNPQQVHQLESLGSLRSDCFHENPLQRPNFTQIQERLNTIFG